MTGSIENDRRVFALDKVSSDATRALVANLKSGETPGEMEAHWEAVNAMWREIGESGGPEALEKSLGAIVDRLLHEKGIPPGHRSNALHALLSGFHKALQDAFEARQR